MVRHDLLTLQLFTAVAECGNIAQASTLHNIAASAVSKRIADLEYGMGVPLLYRRHRGVALTPAGEVLLRHARAIAHMAERMSADMSEFASGVRGHVRIAANISAIAQFLPDDLASFVNANPDVRIELREENSDTILGLVREGLADLGIYNGVMPANDLETLSYRRDRLVVIAPCGHALDGADSVDFARVLDHDLVGLQTGSSLQAMFRAKAAELGRTVRVRVEAMSFDGVRRMVRAGLGIAILPDGAALPYAETSRLTVVPLAEPWAAREIRIAAREMSSLPKVVRVLIDHLRGQSAA
ncbi:LysR substrate-binding domain-containing protein [Azospirillum sp.]|uniref:LysR substrate-binding domain-containing protein n=1 Tax=Azospirillum sp. TaxID=34012 RepID=UPI002629DC94|nr:LysR substrate-binding domain-containing protein [Azospirillum sp.]